MLIGLMASLGWTLWNLLGVLGVTVGSGIAACQSNSQLSHSILMDILLLFLPHPLLLHHGGNKK